MIYGDRYRYDYIMARISPCPNTGCWLWAGSVKSNGYGQVGGKFRIKKCHVHIAVFEHLHGPVPKGLELDHLCRVRSCCNPDHLEPVTRQENCRRSPMLRAWAVRQQERQKAKTRCKHGHPFDEANTRHRPRGSRDCRACGRIRAKNKAAKKAMEANRDAVEASAADGPVLVPDGVPGDARDLVPAAGA